MNTLSPGVTRRFSAVSVVAPIIFLFLCVSSPAQRPERISTASELKKIPLEQLAELSVSSVAKAPLDAFRLPAAISVLTEEDIRNSGATNLPDLLRLVQGVEVSQISANKWAVGIRGFQGYLSRSVLVLIDGRSVYTPLFAGVYWEMQDTLLEDIARIEIIRGPAGTIWGANAVNGVINIITKSAYQTRGMLVSAASGNVEQGAIQARYGEGDDRLSYRVWGKAFTRGPEFHSDDQDFDDYRRAQLGFRMDMEASDHDTLEFSANVYGMKVGTRLNLSTFSPPAIRDTTANVNYFGQSVLFGWSRVMPSQGDIQFRSYFDRTDRRDLNYREIRKTVVFDFVHRLPVQRHEITWGAGARVSPSKFFQRVPTVVFMPAEETYNIFSAFVQDSLPLLGNRLQATLGTKFEHNTYSGFEVQPTGRLAWYPTARQTAWVAVARAVRTPSRIEEGFRFSALAVPGIPLYFRLIGDSTFDSEQLVSYEAGYRRYFTRWGFIGANVFYNRYDDLLSVENRPVEPELSPEPAHSILPLFLRNGIRAQTKGLEIGTLVDVTEWLRWKANYSHVHLDAGRGPISNDASTVKQLEGDTPQHKVTIESGIRLPRQTQLNLVYRYVSAIPNQRVASYSTGDIRVARTFGGRLEVAVVGRNLLQPHHAEYGTLPGPLVQICRSAFIKLTWSEPRQ